jgi:hypothetical protein
MIDLENDDCIGLEEVIERLPRFGGKRIHLSTVIRWIRVGLNGVKLDAAKLGARHVTTWPAVQRFLREQNEPKGQPSSNATTQEVTVTA